MDDETTSSEPEPAAADEAAAQSSDEALRRGVLEALLSEAAFDGFTGLTLERAARQAGVSSAELHRLFPRGVQDALAFWSEEEDRAMAERFAASDLQPRGLTAKIRALVKDRIEALDWNREAARRAAATLALPQHARLGARLVWRTADQMWRAAGDSSTDFNWYTKRMSLGLLYSSVLSHWFADDGDAAAEDPYAQSWDFLDARIGDLMRFEKAKAQALKVAPDPAAIASFLGRLRYGSNR